MMMNNIFGLNINIDIGKFLIRIFEFLISGLKKLSKPLNYLTKFVSPKNKNEREIIRYIGDNNTLKISYYFECLELAIIIHNRIDKNQNIDSYEIPNGKILEEEIKCMVNNGYILTDAYAPLFKSYVLSGKGMRYYKNLKILEKALDKIH